MGQGATGAEERHAAMRNEFVGGEHAGEWPCPSAFDLRAHRLLRCTQTLLILGV